LSLLEEYRQCLDNMGLIMAGYDLPVEDTVQQLLKCVSSEKLFQAYLAEAVTATGAANVPSALKEKLGACSLAHLPHTFCLSHRHTVVDSHSHSLLVMSGRPPV
jgi:hypothetical protein